MCSVGVGVVSQHLATFMANEHVVIGLRCVAVPGNPPGARLVPGLTATADPAYAAGCDQYCILGACITRTDWLPGAEVGQECGLGKAAVRRGFNVDDDGDRIEIPMNFIAEKENNPHVETLPGRVCRTSSFHT